MTGPSHGRVHGSIAISDYCRKLAEPSKAYYTDLTCFTVTVPAILFLPIS